VILNDKEKQRRSDEEIENSIYAEKCLEIVPSEVIPFAEWAVAHKIVFDARIFFELPEEPSGGTGAVHSRKKNYQPGTKK
jgi:hypothetical protein